jgi:hypothetical protein
MRMQLEPQRRLQSRRSSSARRRRLATQLRPRPRPAQARHPPERLSRPHCVARGRPPFRPPALFALGCLLISSTNYPSLPRARMWLRSCARAHTNHHHHDSLRIVSKSGPNSTALAFSFSPSASTFNVGTSGGFSQHACSTSPAASPPSFLHSSSALRR